MGPSDLTGPDRPRPRSRGGDDRVAIADGRPFPRVHIEREEAPHLLGGFSEYGYVLPESGRIRVPDNVPNELASLSSCAFRSVMNAFDNLGGIAPDETVAILDKWDANARPLVETAKQLQ